MDHVRSTGSWWLWSFYSGWYPDRAGVDHLKTDRHDLTVLCYDGGLPPCPCIADGIMIATQATPGQTTLVMSPEEAAPEYMAIIIIKNRKTNDAVRYTVAKEWHPKILAWRELQPPVRFER